jgi:hypothetical protein
VSEIAYRLTLQRGKLAVNLLAEEEEVDARRQ